MIVQSPDNPHAHLTAKERDRPSWPTRQLLERGLIRGRVLDFGSGYGADVAFLARRGFDVTAYDPHYAPAVPEGRFDTILCNYVLNVLLPEEQPHVLMAVSELLDPSGHAYFAVRRDLRQSGFRKHRKHEVPTYQHRVALPYPSVLANDFCEIYAYRHVNQMEERPATRCPFCRISSRHELLTESATAYALFDKYPVSPGHALIIPKRHVGDYFDLTPREQAACWMVVSRVQDRLRKDHAADGFNVGINAGRAAGQTVMHAHIHLIPRYAGDVANPRGGVRHVIPGKGDYRARRR